MSNPSAQPFKWRHENLIELLTTGKQATVTNPIHLNAFRTIDRSKFVVPEQLPLAHADRILPAAYGEVHTDPKTVARQINLIKPQIGKKYLHLGTGTGYATAILAFIIGNNGKLYSIERIQWLWEQARKNLRQYTQIKNAELLYRDGSIGLPDKAPFDGIIVSFISPNIRNTLQKQLAIGGRLVLPLEDNELLVVERVDEDSFIDEIYHDFNSLAFRPGKTGVA